MRALHRYTTSSTVAVEFNVAAVSFVRDSDVTGRRVDVSLAASFSGESDLLSMVSGGGAGRRARPAT